MEHIIKPRKVFKMKHLIHNLSPKDTCFKEIKEYNKLVDKKPTGNNLEEKVKNQREHKEELEARLREIKGLLLVTNQDTTLYDLEEDN